MLKRYAISIALGGVVTLIVLFTMQALIVTPGGDLDESGPRHFVDFVRVDREEIVQRKDRKPEKPREPDAPPPQAVQPRVDAIDPSQVSLQVPMAPVDVEISVELGRQRLTLDSALELGEQSLIELDRVVGEPVDVRLNGKLFARGEVVTVSENFGVRLNEIVRE